MTSNLIAPRTHHHQQWKSKIAFGRAPGFQLCTYGGASHCCGLGHNHDHFGPSLPSSCTLPGHQLAWQQHGIRCPHTSFLVLQRSLFSAVSFKGVPRPLRVRFLTCSVREFRNILCVFDGELSFRSKCRQKNGVRVLFHSTLSRAVASHSTLHVHTYSELTKFTFTVPLVARMRWEMANHTVSRCVVPSIPMCPMLGGSSRVAHIRTLSEPAHQDLCHHIPSEPVFHIFPCVAGATYRVPRPH